MRGAVLGFFDEDPDTYRSGEELSKELGVSRAAVWKEIHRLELEGYSFEAAPRRGYRLISRPDRLFPWEISRRLKTAVLGREIIYRETVGSTNDWAKDLAKGGAAHGTLVTAETQLRGRGRRGRSWASPWGKGLWFSLILRPSFSPFEVPRLSILAGVALRRSLRTVAGVDVGLKWPNDVVLRGRKLAGVLTEMQAEQDRVEFVVVGIGLNTNVPRDAFPEGVRGRATSLFEETGKPMPRIDLLAQIVLDFEGLYREFQTGGLDWMGEAREASVVLGRWVKVEGEKLSWEGRATELGDDGSLILETGTGEIVRLLSGDVSLTRF